MRLIDAISIHDENKTAIVIGTNGAILAVYNGRDAIPESLNDADLIGIGCETIGNQSAVVYTVDAE